MNESKLQEIQKLNKDIQDAKFNDVIEAALKTSERVLKRVTDGIYRQPSSALRELIANSYDADATLVEVQTDPPRFKRIIVRDNGNGFSIEALSYMINSIGGSAKRTIAGKGMGICGVNDRLRSPGGRKLIGKIGIGLFSVAQLTKEFQIITKTKGTDYRTIADVLLHTYSEDVDDPDKEFNAGSVKIWKVSASDIESHGTEVILRNILHKTWEDLTDKEMWFRCNPNKMDSIEEIVSVTADPPSFHIGCVHEDMPDELDKLPSIPWDVSDSPEIKFRKLVDGMYDLRGRKNNNPSIFVDLDYYLRMLWILGLSLPLDYVDGHPFDLGYQDGLLISHIGNNSKDQAKVLDLSGVDTIRDKLSLISPERGVTTEFRVIVDGVQLLRPIKFKELPRTLESVPYSLLFVGKAKPDLSPYPIQVRGGDDLEFEAYFFWNHVVVPKEHAGVMVRINDANGVLFDSTFMQYPSSEHTRKKQLTAEVFVTKGLDAALNIDRESFNYSHPHYQYLTHWIHNAFRQFSNKHKAISKEIRESKENETTQKEIDDLQKTVDESIRVLQQDIDIPLPMIEFEDDDEVQAEQRKKGILSFQRHEVFDTKTDSKDRSRSKHVIDSRFEEKIKAVAKILKVYDVFENMPYEKQQRLLRDIVKIFSK